MGKDTPDWGKYAGTYKSGEVTDLAELAVRAGAPFGFSKSGEQFLIDDFSLGLGRWNAAALFGGLVPVLSADAWLYGGFSCLLDAEAVAGGTSWINSTFAGYPLTPLGLQLGFSVMMGNSLLYLILEYHQGGTVSTFNARFDFPNDMLSIEDDGFVYHDIITGLALEPGATPFHFCKMVIDPTKRAYGWIQFDNRIVGDLGISAIPSPPDDYDQLSVEISNESVGGGFARVYVDHVILTYNEPL